MRVSQGVHCWLEYHNLHSKKTPSKLPVDLFQTHRAIWRKGPELPDPEEVLSFLTDINQRTNQLTKRTDTPNSLPSSTSSPKTSTQFPKPCDTPMLKKLYRPPGPIRWAILEKEVVDEIIFRTIKPGID